MKKKQKEKNNERDVVLDGTRPTGKLHLGHYVGVIQNRVKHQELHDEMYCMIADVQAFTDNADNPEKVSSNVREVAIDNIASGVDPQKTTFFIQSQIPEIAELTVFFLNLVTVARLKRNPTVKAEIVQKEMGEAVPAGFLMYPISQSADILFAKSTGVFGGDDQLPMIEQANDIAEKFNRYYGEVFPYVKPIVSETTRLVGIDGNAKASKSLGNAIELADSIEGIKDKVMQMYTDPEHIRVEDPGKVEGNVVFAYLDAFDPDTEKVAQLKADYQKGGLGDVIIKKYCAEVLENLIAPIREKRQELEQKPDYVMDVLKEGTMQARKKAEQTMSEVREAMKIDYF